jgi:hypothetical protein
MGQGGSGEKEVMNSVLAFLPAIPMIAAILIFGFFMLMAAILILSAIGSGVYRLTLHLFSRRPGLDTSS